MPALTKVPAIPRAFRWLALQGDAELCEYAAYAGKALSTSARAPKAVVEKAVGRGQAARIVKGLLGVGRTLLLESCDSADHYVQGYRMSAQEAAREVAGLQRAGICTRSLSAKSCFLLSRSLEGRGGDADVLIGTLEYVGGRYSNAAKYWLSSSNHSTSSRAKACFYINSIPALIETRAIDSALAVPQGDCDYNCDSDISALAKMNKAVLAVYAGEPSSFLRNFEGFLEKVSSSPALGPMVYFAESNLRKIERGVRNRSIQQVRMSHLDFARELLGGVAHARPTHSTYATDTHNH